MELSDLPARELARIDAICLEFESRLRESLHEGADALQVSDRVDALVENYGGEHGAILRRELEAISHELQRQHDTHLTTPSPNKSTVPLDEGDIATHAAPTPPLDPGSSSETTAVKLPTLADRIGPYSIISVLGRGGMGIVYRATDTRLDRSVAIKMLSLHGRQSQSLIERFQREAKAVAGLTHPHIVELFDVGIYDGMPYVVMEHLRGETLLERMRPARISKDPISIAQVRNWGIQLSDALATAHSQGVIHRDIKPENVMVMDRPGPPGNDAGNPSASPRSATEHGASLKLFDFGLSRVGSSRFESETEQSDVDIAELLADGDTSTRIGMILGTPGYMAPEQAQGGVITPAADIFALGCVLFEALFGRPAFSGETATKRFAAVLEKEPHAEPLRSREETELADLILAMLQKDPADRPTADEVLARLQDKPARDGVSSPDKRDTLVISRRRLIEAVGGAIAGGAIGATLLAPEPVSELQAIESIGVLRFQTIGSLTDSSEDLPIGDPVIDRADLLAGLLANELARLNGITVPKYESLSATEPQDFREVAKRLEVDALITGVFTLENGPEVLSLSEKPPQPKLLVNIDIVSGKTGKLIEGTLISIAPGKNLIEQTGVARKIAARIGHELAQGSEHENLKDPEAFNCLIKGRTVSSPDTTHAMERALRCFQHAASIDDTYPDAQAGIALTAISLASRVDEPRAIELIDLSQNATDLALSLDPENSVALLARAMLDYQVLADFHSAARILRTLKLPTPNQWQVYQQSAWLNFILGNEELSLNDMLRAVKLHGTSWFLRTEHARAEWFRGNTDRAIDASKALLESDHKTSEDELSPRGLLIDIYEHTGRFAQAAQADPNLSWEPNQGVAAYYAAREQRIEALPYGPFGPTINAAILQLRRAEAVAQAANEKPARDSNGGSAGEPGNESDAETSEQLLARLITTQLPMLPLVLCKHPAMNSLSQLEQARETYRVLRYQ
ncbi:protein kinase domain-containing protein [Allorhodopirellula solitaria]|uniref:Serine/threonine-protein kinase PrkC n=1 Tax=Allorhodopirellula solitaria TaxID=2527987 RepID=A0A5C5XUT3_9BACT|nr:protein kinase [Allorhodopirellula solitaria]TWT65352.1 Serine/threonine-protein kinase PrkC [Allorhodopirellula solitaria]